MAQDSAYWEGEVTGDVITPVSWDAPYSHKEWSEVWAFLMTSNTNKGFVIPGYQDNLLVHASSPAAMTVEVETGAALVRGRIYENTAQNTLTISTNTSSYARIDRVVIAVDFSAQEIRLDVIEGTPNVTPALPSPTQTTSLYEIPIAYIWVVAGGATIPDVDIHDERTFACFSPNFNNTSFTINALKNSEFMAFSELSEALTTNTNPPEEWDLVGTPGTVLGYTKPGQMSRGRAVQVAADAANEGISQTIFVKPSTQYVIKTLVRVTSGDIGTISVTTDSAAPETITRYIRRTNTWLEELIYYETENDATEMTLSLLASGAGDIIQYGQTILVEGFIPGPFRKVKEIITFGKKVTDPVWDAYTPSDGNYLLNVYSDWQKLILAGTHNVLMEIILLDTTSNPVVSSASISKGTIFFNLNGLEADTNYYKIEWAGIEESQYDDHRYIHLTVDATDAGSLEITLNIVGISI